MRFAATCLFGLEKLLGEEIDALGLKRENTIDGRVIFSGDIPDIPRLNINLRYAERVFIVLGTFPARTFTELFDGVRKLRFYDYIGKNDAFPVKGHSIKSALTSIPDCQSIVKKAAVESMKDKYGLNRFDETGIKYQIEFFILKDEATVMIDTSGETLHKRGYRPVSNEAPLRETLAAAMVKIAHLWEDNLFWDPFCGSGTIPVEAALLMSNTAPGLHRGFISEKYPFIPESAWTRSREEAEDKIRRDCRFEAYASDIDPACAALAEANAKRAGMDKYIKCFTQNALDVQTFGRRGTVVCNPPYGERLMTPETARKLYSDMGEAFSRLGSWQIYIISSCDDFERYYKRKADKVRKLYNGMIKCNYYQFFKNRGQKNAD
ncbi:MAG: class I SAM-dependent RNA methyltransferase [Clostridia bacterium]|nr:class I SAM-dependent RNA methyltransferase [Clostridia bacterium]